MTEEQYMQKQRQKIRDIKKDIAECETRLNTRQGKTNSELEYCQKRASWLEIELEKAMINLEV